MGVKQGPRGAEISVAEWNEAGVRTPLLDGVLGASSPDKTIAALLMVAELFEVRRALIDSHPDPELARMVIATHPEVFALNSGSGHNAASLSEVAWRRALTSAVDLGISLTDDHTRLVSVERDLRDETMLAFRVFVPAGETMPTHVIVPLDGADEMARGDGSLVVEKLIPTHEAQVITSQPVAAKLAWPKQMWSLAPTTTLPPQGWSLSLSIFANARLVHEQIVTEHQMMGLMNLVPELAREASEWIERAPLLPDGPYHAEWGVYAGATTIHQSATDPFAIPMVLAGVIHDAGVAVSEWISDNTFAMEQQYPWANLPAEGPYDLPDVSADTYDFER